MGRTRSAGSRAWERQLAQQAINSNGAAAAAHGGRQCRPGLWGADRLLDPAGAPMVLSAQSRAAAWVTGARWEPPSSIECAAALPVGLRPWSRCLAAAIAPIGVVDEACGPHAAPPRWRSLPRRPAGPAAVCMPLRHLGCDRSLVCRAVAAGRGGSAAVRGRVASGALRAAPADRKLRLNSWVLARSACSPRPYCRCTASARRRRRLAQLAHSLPCCCRATGRLRAGAATSRSFTRLDHGFMARRHARLQRAGCPAALILLLAAAAATAQASGSPGKVAACG